MTLSDLWPHFKVMKFFEDEYRKKVLKTKLLLHNRNYICNMWNGTMFVDLNWPLKAWSLLSASAELLVDSVFMHKKDTQTEIIVFNNLNK